MTGADWKVPHMLNTLATFQLARIWLNAAAPLNMLTMFDTHATFHLLMSSLNVGVEVADTTRERPIRI